MYQFPEDQGQIVDISYCYGIEDDYVYKLVHDRSDNTRQWYRSIDAWESETPFPDCVEEVDDWEECEPPSRRTSSRF